VERGDDVVLDDVDLEVPAGRRLTVVGGSGAGKTTLLRTIAGTVPVTSGRIELDGRDITDLAPRYRGVAFVDQEATLQPHLDVRGNLAFPLQLRGVPAEEERARVDAEARAFSLRHLLPRRPRQLSEGERHEVAVARGLVRPVGLLCVDEPLARVDPHRRTELQRELVKVQEGYGVPMLVATNDQRLGLALGHRVAVLHEGGFRQVGPADELYQRPRDTVVATAIGDPPMTLLRGHVERRAGLTTIVAGAVRVRCRVPIAAPGTAVEVGIRPTAWQLAGDEAAAVTVEGAVRRRATLGAQDLVEVATDDAVLDVLLPPPGPPAGARVRLVAPAREVHVFAVPGGTALVHGV
jgi:multiple sugar transport system ATP-binding protein